MKISARWKDVWTRVWKTFAQGAGGVFFLTYVGPMMTLLRDLTSIGPGDNLPVIDLTFWRNAIFAVVAGGMAALLSLIWNGFLEWKSAGTTNRLAGMPADQAAGDRNLGQT